MHALLIEKPVLLLFVLLAVGTLIGMIKFKTVSVGAAAVLFSALAFSAYDAKLALPQIVGDLGLAIFAYCVGVTSGASFFAGLRKGIKPILLVFLSLAACGAMAYGVGRLLDLTPGFIAGTYAGSLTNTPAMAAATERLHGLPGEGDPTVGYALTYLGGVVVMLIGTMLTLRNKAMSKAHADAEGSTLVNLTIRVTKENLPPLAVLENTDAGQVLFSRVKHDGKVQVARDDMVPHPGDRVLVIGTKAAVLGAVNAMGRESTLPLHLERNEVDFRRIMLSSRKLFGRTVWELDLEDKFGATATRVRRADQDLLAVDDLVLQAGDRIRVAAPHDQMGKVAKYLGDSEHGASDINPLGFSLGLALGLLLGAWKFPIFGGSHMELGAAAGPLLVGLVLGRIGRTGRVVWSLPHQASSAMSHLGLLMFLAFAGGRAGSKFVDALSSPVGAKIVVIGLLVTTIEVTVLLVAARWISGLEGPRLAGVLGGANTQPAILAYANDRAGHDQRVALGYAMVYPVAMVTKIFVAQFLAGL